MPELGVKKAYQLLGYRTLGKFDRWVVRDGLSDGCNCLLSLMINNILTRKLNIISPVFGTLFAPVISRGESLCNKQSCEQVDSTL